MDRTKSNLYDKIDLIRQTIKNTDFNQKDLNRLFDWLNDSVEYLDKYIEHKKLKATS